MKITFAAEDIQTLRPNWSLEECESWLQENEKYIRDRLIELGWEVIETLLPCNTDKEMQR